MLLLWEMGGGGGSVTESERGDEKQSCFGLSSEPLSKENLLGGL